MFDRLKYKKEALSALKNNWEQPCLLTIIFALLAPVSTAVFGRIGLGIGGILSVSIIVTCIRIIDLASQVPAGITGHESKGKITFSDFLGTLESHWLPALLGSLWYSMWVILWSLLFFFPGIVKAYSYSMMFYVLAENPKIGAMKAMDISKILTQEHKSDLFMLDLRFLGWAFLSALASGLGFIWLNPYRVMTKTFAYYDLKKMAIAQNKLSPADFNP